MFWKSEPCTATPAARDRISKHIRRTRCMFAMAGLCALSVMAMEPTEASSQPALADGIIVKYRDLPSVQSQSAAARVEAFSRKTTTPLFYRRPMSGGAHVLGLNKVRPLKEVQVLAKELAKEPDVEYAEPNTIMWPDFAPNDTDYNLQWHYHEETGGINVESAWNITAGEGVVVAVVDTGYRPHIDLSANIVGGYDFISDIGRANDGNGRDGDARDPGDWREQNECPNPNPQNSSWHGTHVAGTVAAVTNNGLGVAGVAWGGKVLPVRVLGKCGGTLADIADAIRWAAGLPVAGVPANSHPAQVINMSLGGGGICSTTYSSAILAARNAGVSIVVSAGNNNADAVFQQPANCAGVITVAATNRNGAKAYYSNFGTVVEIAAPGGETAINLNGVYSTLNSGAMGPAADSYEFFQGTSMAAPHVAGAVAMLYALDPGITPDEVETILAQTARSFPGTCSQCGAGIVDAGAAVEALTGTSFELAWLVPVIHLILF